MQETTATKEIWDVYCFHYEQITQHILHDYISSLTYVRGMDTQML